MEFVVRAWSAQARLGSLHLGATGPQLETPCLLLLTRKGLPAFIPPDLFHKLHPDALALQVSPLHFLDSPPPEVVAEVGGLHKMLCLPEHGLVAVGRDSIMDEADGEGTTKLGASFKTSFGRRIVGPVKYMEVINACKPNLWASLPDEVPAWVSEKRNRMSVGRTLQWLDHCLSLSTDMGCLGVVVGGSSVEQRTHSAQQTATRNVAGFSLGGFGLGEAAEDRGPLLEAVTASLPMEKPRHVSGLGMPEEVLQAVAAGVDLFDSTYPHMLTMGGYAMTFPVTMEDILGDFANKNLAVEEWSKSDSDSAKICLRSVSFRLDESPLVDGCKCYTCRKHSRAYIHHLLNTHEMLAQTLLDIHNMYHYLGFFQAIREAIRANDFPVFHNQFISHRRQSTLLLSSQ